MTFRQIIVKMQISLAVLTALLSICFFFAGGYAGKRILCPPAAIAAVILLILAFNFRPNLLPMRLLSQEQLSHLYAYGLCPL